MRFSFGNHLTDTVRAATAEISADVWVARSTSRGVDSVCRLRDLDASLTEIFDLGLEEVLIRTGGPLRRLRQERSSAERRRAVFWDEALGQQLCVRDAAVRSFVERLRHGGSLGKQPYESAKGEALMASLRVGETLPREQVIERSTLANEMLRDPHALDDGTDVGRLLVQQLAARDRLPGAPLTAGDRRALLQRYGVLGDPASATVLTLGLRPAVRDRRSVALNVTVPNSRLGPLLVTCAVYVTSWPTTAGFTEDVTIVVVWACWEATALGTAGAEGRPAL